MQISFEMAITETLRPRCVRLGLNVRGVYKLGALWDASRLPLNFACDDNCYSFTPLAQPVKNYRNHYGDPNTDDAKDY